VKFKLSGHAEKRIKQRKIRLEWISAALENPDHIESDADDPSLIHLIKAIPEKGFLKLRVICNETIEPWLVVTAFFDGR
jgi:hypothetical protein